MAFDPMEPLTHKEVEEEAEYLKNSAVSIYQFAVRAQTQGAHPAAIDALWNAYYLVRSAQEKMEWTLPAFPR